MQECLDLESDKLRRYVCLSDILEDRPKKCDGAATSPSVTLIVMRPPEFIRYAYMREI